MGASTPGFPMWSTTTLWMGMSAVWERNGPIQANLTVAPGTTVTVVNKDSTGHTVTSESAADAFTPGSVGGVQFDTGVFTGTRTFVIPASAANGTVVPYYCQVHKGMMANRGQITISTSATGGGGGGGGGRY